jgi:DNA-directed RNA polymerase sigma subunit (sigma70/sigma32)
MTLPGQSDSVDEFDRAWEALLRLRRVQAKFTRKRLPLRADWIIRMRDAGADPWDLGIALNITRERVRQIEIRERRLRAAKVE